MERFVIVWNIGYKSNLYLVIVNFIIGCNVNCKNNICDVFNSCIEGCKDGYWGFICILNCLMLCFWKVCE